MRVSICSNDFLIQSERKRLACHEVFANTDHVLMGSNEKSAVFESDDVRVAFIVAETDQDNGVSVEQMEDRNSYICRAIKEICAAKAKNDFVIVSYPCGTTMEIYQPARIRQICRTMVKSGADVVLCRIGGGIGSYELYRSANILYGYDGQKSKKDLGKEETGVIVHLDISDVIELQFVPVRVTESQIVPVKGKERQKCLEQLVANSEKMK